MIVDWYEALLYKMAKNSDFAAGYFTGSTLATAGTLGGILASPAFIGYKELKAKGAIKGLGDLFKGKTYKTGLKAIGETLIDLSKTLGKIK